MHVSFHRFYKNEKRHKFCIKFGKSSHKLWLHNRRLVLYNFTKKVCTSLIFHYMVSLFNQWCHFKLLTYPRTLVIHKMRIIHNHMKKKNKAIFFYFISIRIEICRLVAIFGTVGSNTKWRHFSAGRRSENLEGALYI